MIPVFEELGCGWVLVGWNSPAFYSKEFIEILKRQMYMSESTWHKVMNPLCPTCLKDRIA